MSTFEKIASFGIAVVLIATIIFSYHEITEPSGYERGPSFKESIGQTLAIGTFNTVLSEESSGGTEENCQMLQPVILATLHDIDEHLEELGVYNRGVFEVNQRTLDLLCQKEASLTLSNGAGAKLILVKAPFVRKIPLGGGPSDIGTDIRISATIIVPGTVPPSKPTTYGEELIPDRYLGASSTVPLFYDAASGTPAHANQ